MKLDFSALHVLNEKYRLITGTQYLRHLLFTEKDRPETIMVS